MKLRHSRFSRHDRIATRVHHCIQFRAGPDNSIETHISPEILVRGTVWEARRVRLPRSARVVRLSYKEIRAMRETKFVMAAIIAGCSDGTEQQRMKKYDWVRRNLDSIMPTEFPAT